MSSFDSKGAEEFARQFAGLCLDAAPMCRLARPDAESLRSAQPVVPIVKFDWACAADITVVIDTMAGMHAAASRLTGQDPDSQSGNLFALPCGHMLTAVIICALLLTMPFWSTGLSPQARSVLNQEIGLAALAAALIGDGSSPSISGILGLAQIILGEGRALLVADSGSGVSAVLDPGSASRCPPVAEAPGARARQSPVVQRALRQTPSGRRWRTGRAAGET
jgi:hypothetical protein